MEYRIIGKSCLPQAGDDFPRSLPGKVLNAAVDEVENNTKAPRPLAVLSALTAISIAAQGVFNFAKPTGQIIPVSLYSLLIAKSGERKSTVGDIFLEPVRKFQLAQEDQYKLKLVVYKSDLELWQQVKRRLQQKIAILSVSGESSDDETKIYQRHSLMMPDKPKDFKVLYEDATSEALFHGLYTNLPTAGLISSEGGAVLNSRAFKDLSKQNSMWSGESITIDRKGGDSFRLDSARLTVAMLIQRGVLDEYLEKNGDISRSSGLWARYLIASPESTQGYRLIRNPTVSWLHREVYSRRISEILERNLELLTSSEVVRTTLQFTDEASDRWLSVFNDIEVEIREGGRFYEMGDHASKLADNISRVAALIHIFEGVEGGVTLEALNYSIKICLWCSDAFKSVFSKPSQEFLDAELLESWLVKEMGLRGYIERNYVRQYAPNKLRNINRLNQALEVLESQDKVRLFQSRRVNYVGAGRSW